MKENGFENTGQLPSDEASFLAETEQESSSEAPKLSVEERAEEGEKILKDYLKKIQAETKSFLDVVAGTQRSLQTSRISGTVNIELGSKPDLSAPILETGHDFALLAEKLVGVIHAFEGSIQVNKEALRDSQSRARALLELKHIHDDLESVLGQSERLRGVLASALKNFSSFNGENAQTQDYREADIKFDIDNLNTSLVAAKAIGERVVYLDIDVNRGQHELGQAA